MVTVSVCYCSVLISGHLSFSHSVIVAWHYTILSCMPERTDDVTVAASHCARCSVW